jgi:hypothetical protein
MGYRSSTAAAVPANAIVKMTNPRVLIVLSLGSRLLYGKIVEVEYTKELISCQGEKEQATDPSHKLA